MEACCGGHHLGRLLVEQGHADVAQSTSDPTSRRRRTMIAMPRRLPRRDPADDAVRGAQERGAARCAGSALRAPPAGRTARRYRHDALPDALAVELRARALMANCTFTNDRKVLRLTAED